MKKSIRCPDHKDKNASAVIFYRQDGSQWLHCLGCKVSRLYKESEGEHMKITEEEEYDENIYGTDIKQCFNHLDLLDNFESEKGIDSDMISNMEGFVTDQGYLGFKYGKDREVYRNLVKDNRPRFINVGSNKGLMGDDMLDALEGEEVFLVEGLTDYISFKYKFGNNVVTSFGAELSEEQAYLLRNNTVFIIFDRDFAGYKGAKQAEARLKEVGATPITFELPNGIDLNAYGKKVDVNYLLHRETNAFKEWLWGKLKRYKNFDGDYLDTFKLRKPLKSYTTDIPNLKMTQGGLYIISGPPKTGKSTMGVSLMDQFSKQGGYVLYCNYDASKDEIIARLASRYTDTLGWTTIEANPQLLQVDHHGVEDKIKQCLKNIKIVNGLTIDEIKYCKKYYTHVIIDYIQRVPNYDNDKVRGLERIMDILSDLASNEGMTIVGISRQSLSGNPYSGSASIPYHAHATMLLDKKDDDIIACNIDLNRKGETGTFLFKVNYQHQRLKPTKLNEIADEKMGNLWFGGNK